MTTPRILAAVALIGAASGACSKKSEPSTASAAPEYKLPELDGPEPILIPPNYGRYLASTLSKPDSAPKEEKAGVTLKVCVDREGAVTAAEVVKAFTQEIDRAVVDAARRWRFKPYMVKETPKAFCYVQMFTYQRGAQPPWSF
jgi:TonB family protein